MPSHRVLNVSMTTHLLHGLAHIELNAIDMVWDTLLRFARIQPMPLDFYLDFVAIASDESRHFELLCERLKVNGSYYGALPAHQGLWLAAFKSRHDLKTRIANIQLVQEARALDSWERLVIKFRSQGDLTSAKLVNTICEEEVAHVKAGVKWFEYLCAKDNENPTEAFSRIIKDSNVNIFPPFNDKARAEAGLRSEYYHQWQK